MLKIKTRQFVSQWCALAPSAHCNSGMAEQYGLTQQAMGVG
jgi:hypothetical protein